MGEGEESDWYRKCGTVQDDQEAHKLRRDASNGAISNELLHHIIQLTTRAYELDKS
jgi:hypothetical protein